MVCADHLLTGARRRNSSKKFSRKVTWTISLLFHRRLELGENCKALAIRRQIVVQSSAEVVKLLIGPQVRLAGDERSLASPYNPPP